MSKKIILPLANGFEEIEAVTIIDLLRRANIEVIISTTDELLVCGAHNIELKANILLKDIEVNNSYDALIIPGGLNCAQSLANNKLLFEMLKIFCAKNKLIAAICASSALVLGKNGFLDSIKATAYPSFKNYISNFIDEGVVVDKNFITAQGPSMAIAFSLKIIKNLSGEALSKKIAQDILYNEYV